MVLAKICGIQNAKDAAAAAAAGADALGFHVDLNGGRSPLFVSDAARIISGLPANVSSVVVTSATDAEKLTKLAQKTGAKILQLYGDATPEAIQTVKGALPAIEIWKVVNVSGAESIEKAKTYDGVADAIALDKAQNPMVRGGSGQTIDWNIAKKIVEAVSTPVILAGGLNPENLVEAIWTVQPYGVDVNSGVSNPDGSKDLEKVRLFVERTKSAA